MFIRTSTSIFSNDTQERNAAGSASETTEAQLQFGMDLGVSNDNPGDAVVAICGWKIIVVFGYIGIYIYMCCESNVAHKFNFRTGAVA